MGSNDRDGLEDELPDYDLIEEDHLNRDALSDLVLYTLDWSVSSLLERIGSSIDINPSFQRRDAWSLDRKSLYIESLLVGLPVPQIVLAEDQVQKGRFIVLDGKQRLITMKQFASPNETYPGFKLRKLEFATEATGMDFSDMQSSLLLNDLAEGFLTQPVRTIVVRNWQNPAVLYQVFVRLNQGSVSLSPQELRQALFPSAFTSWVNERSADSQEIRRARRIKKPDFRMRDAEMLLRYTAFQERIEKYRGNLRLFLDEACESGASKWEARGETYYNAIAERCEEAIRRTFLVFDDDAFRRFEARSYNNRFNIAVFDLMTQVFGDQALSTDVVTEHSEEIRSAYEEMSTTDGQFSQSLLATTKSIGATAQRIISFGEKVGEITGHTPGIVERARVLLQAA